MRTNRFVVWLLVPLFLVSLGFLASCAKEGLRETPDKPRLKGHVYPETGDLAREDKIFADRVAAGEVLLTDEELAKKLAAVREQCLREWAEKDALELRRQFEEERIYYLFDSSRLLQGSKEVLMRKATYLTEANPGVGVLIEGHCDERGSVEYNLALGQRRAEAAYKYLVGLGVQPERLKLVSYGKERPLDPAHSEEAWAKNRRAEFRVID